MNAMTGDGQAFVLRVDGTKERLPLREPTLDELQEAVGGYIEVLQIEHNGLIGHMVLNEDGKLRGLALNPMANAIAHATAGIADGDFIVGDVVILTGKAKLT